MKYNRFFTIVVWALILCAFCSVFVSCFPNNYEIYAIYKICDFVPGVSYNDSVVTESEILEYDNYDRMLLKSKEYFFPTDQVEEMYVICQKYNDGGIYIYEDVNYILLSYNDNIENFKSNNDWNKPLNESKMSYKAATIGDVWNVVKSQPTDVDMTDVKNKFIEETGIVLESVTDELEVDIDPEGKRLNMYAVGDTREIYIVICDNEYNIMYTKLEVNENYQKQISDLKHQAGWIYN